MPNRTPVDPKLIEAAARLADLPLTAARAAELVPAVNDTFGALDALARSTLGDVQPAFAYRAQWGGDDGR